MDTLARIRLLTGDDPFWNQQNPVLLKGEVGFRNVEGDDPLMRVGDGIRAWNQLPDMNKFGPVGPAGPQGPVGNTGERGPMGPPGDQTSPFRTPFEIQDSLDSTMLKFDNQGLLVNGIPDGVAWVAQFIANNAHASGSNGVYIRAGTIPSDNVLLVALLDGTPVLKIQGDGSGTLGGPNWGTGLNWNASYGHFGFNVGAMSGPSWPVVTIQSNPGDMSALDVNSANQTAPYCWIARFRNTGSAAGASYGVLVQAGLNSADQSFVVTRQDGSQNLFRVLGNGSLWTGGVQPGSGSTLVLAAGGQICVLSSSARYKTDVQTLRRERIRKTIAALRPVSYKSTCESDDRTLTHYGLIAEEVEAVDKNLVTYDDEGGVRAVQYDRIAMLLLPVVQELLGLDESPA